MLIGTCRRRGLFWQCSARVRRLIYRTLIGMFLHLVTCAISLILTLTPPPLTPTSRQRRRAAIRQGQNRDAKRPFVEGKSETPSGESPRAIQRWQGCSYMRNWPNPPPNHTPSNPHRKTETPSGNLLRAKPRRRAAICRGGNQDAERRIAEGDTEMARATQQVAEQLKCAILL